MSLLSHVRRGLPSRTLGTLKESQESQEALDESYLPCSRHSKRFNNAQVIGITSLDSVRANKFVHEARVAGASDSDVDFSDKGSSGFGDDLLCPR